MMLDAAETRVDTLEADLDTLQARLDTLQARLDTLKARLDTLKADLDVPEPLFHVAYVGPENRYAGLEALQAHVLSVEPGGRLVVQPLQGVALPLQGLAEDAEL
jgi:multidrug resistance efflux pump